MVARAEDIREAAVRQAVRVEPAERGAPVEGAELPVALVERAGKAARREELEAAHEAEEERPWERAR